MMAIETGNLFAINLLIKNGADVNALGVNGWTAVHAAVDSIFDNANQTGNNDDIYLNILKTLLDNGGDLGIRDRSGMTPIDVAKEYGCHNIELLIGRGKTGCV